MERALEAVIGGESGSRQFKCEPAIKPHARIVDLDLSDEGCRVGPAELGNVGVAYTVKPCPEDRRGAKLYERIGFDQPFVNAASFSFVRSAIDRR